MCVRDDGGSVDIDYPRVPQKRKTKDVINGGVSIFGVVKESNSVSAFRQISEKVTANFKFGHCPVVRSMCRAAHIPKLRLK